MSFFFFFFFGAEKNLYILNIAIKTIIDGTYLGKQKKKIK